MNTLELITIRRAANYDGYEVVMYDTVKNCHMKVAFEIDFPRDEKFYDRLIQGIKLSMELIANHKDDE